MALPTQIDRLHLKATCWKTIFEKNNMDGRIYQYPLFISYPRTGAHWINCVMEIYFDRPRLREKRVTFLDVKRNDWLWFHDHDIKLKIVHEDVLYLYRNAIDTIFSLIVYEFVNPIFPMKYFLKNKNPLNVSENTIKKHCYRYRSHLHKWLVSDNKARTAIRHENFRSMPEKEFKKICMHFERLYDAHRVKQAFGIATKENIVKQAEKLGNFPGMRNDMLKEQYNKQRAEFKDKWGKYIQDTVITSDLGSFFS